MPVTKTDTKYKIKVIKLDLEVSTDFLIDGYILDNESSYNQYDGKYCTICRKRFTDKEVELAEKHVETHTDEELVKKLVYITNYVHKVKISPKEKPNIYEKIWGSEEDKIWDEENHKEWIDENEKSLQGADI